MSKKEPIANAKLILRIEVDGKQPLDRVVEGASRIADILGPAGILDADIMALLGYL